MSSIPTSGPIDLTDHTAVVTGAAGGMGKAVCGALAREGADVIATDIDEDGLEDVESIVEEHGQGCESVACNVTSPDDIRALRDAALDAFESIELVITLHGAINRASVSETPLESWNRDIEINLSGTFLVIQAFWDHLVENEYGKVVCIGSLAGSTGGLEAGASYSAAKGCIHSLVKTLAQEGAQNNVYANAIAPGAVKTPFNDLSAEDISKEVMPLRRMGRPEDIAEGVLFLGSQMANWVTGSVLHIDGGTTMR